MATYITPLALGLALLASGCTSSLETSPPRTATEQLLISRAADEAAERMDLALAPGTRIWIDSSDFEHGDKGFEGSDGRYAIGAIRDRLLRDGARLADRRDEADVVVMLRAGALSIDEKQTLLGIPEFDIPVPLAGTFTFPGLSLFKEAERRGIAKFVATAVDARTGAFIDTTDPQFGFSHKRRWVVLIFFSGASDDLIPEAQEEKREDGVLPGLR